MSPNVLQHLPTPPALLGGKDDLPAARSAGGECYAHWRRLVQTLL